MAEQSSFFNSKNHDRTYNAKHWADYFLPLFKSGVFNGGLQVIANGGMSVKINEGYAWIDGYAYHLTEGLILDLEIASGNMNRKDNIVIRLDLSNRWIKGDVVTGTYYSATAIAPEPQNTATLHELIVARINVPAGTTEITQDMITDTRMDAELCGWVCGAVEQIDFSQIQAQFNTFFSKTTDEILTEYNTYVKNIESLETQAQTRYNDMDAELTDYEEQQKTDFEAWLEDIKSILNENVAGNLQNQIGALENLETENKSSLVDAINENSNSILIEKRIFSPTSCSYTSESINSANVCFIDADFSNCIDELKDNDILVIPWQDQYISASLFVLRAKTQNGTKNYTVEKRSSTVGTKKIKYIRGFFAPIISIRNMNSYMDYTGIEINGIAHAENYEQVGIQYAPTSYEALEGEDKVYDAAAVTKMVDEVSTRAAATPYLVEMGNVNGDTVVIELGQRCTYMLFLRAVTVSTGKIYGFRQSVIVTNDEAIPTVKASIGNAYTSTNAGFTVTLSNDESTGFPRCSITTTATYSATYALYEISCY